MDDPWAEGRGGIRLVWLRAKASLGIPPQRPPDNRMRPEAFIRPEERGAPQQPTGGLEKFPSAKPIASHPLDTYPWQVAPHSIDVDIF